MHAPLATYRLQLTEQFGFEAARAVLPYLVDLGVSHVYLSPCAQAIPGSTHGYDVIDPSRIDAARGGEPTFRNLLESARALGLGVLLDIVPNHLAADERNPRWADVLARGASSRYAKWFDIDWDRGDATGARRVVLPVLGDTVSREIEAGNLRVVEEPGKAPMLGVYERRLPLNSGSIGIKLHRGRVQDLLDAQHYRLEYWRDGLQSLNWRRFFDITTLAGIRVEDPEVFDDVHRVPLQLLAEGLLDGLRVDHPDGLHDPAAYARRLRAAAPGAWLLFEKILEPGEPLPEDWPVDGTTGYDFLEIATNLFVDPAGKASLVATCRERTGACPEFAELLEEKKRVVLEELFPREAERLGRLLGDAARDHGVRCRPDQARVAVESLLVALPVYRTYVDDEGRAPPHDREVLRMAEDTATRLQPPPDPEVLQLLMRAVGGELQTPTSRELRARLQQLSGPVMAKGLEDTALYCDRRLLALCEVGSSPARFGVSSEAFHEFCRTRGARWPRTLNATSTHDTKRSEDVRLRIATLSEVAADWNGEARRWAELATRHRSGGLPASDTVYALFQTLVGIWPADPERIAAASIKAEREAKLHTSWLEPEEDFERALRDLVYALLDDTEFLARLEPWVARIRPAARRHALALTVLKTTAPGIPDIYQGSETWNEALVDPDNRRPVDFTVLQERSTEHVPRDLAGALATDDPALETWLLRRLLRLRRDRWPDLGPDGGYRALLWDGTDAESFLAYRRGDGIVVALARHTLACPPATADARLSLPAGRWRSALVEEPDTLAGEVGAGRLCEPLGIAVLVRDDA